MGGEGLPAPRDRLFLALVIGVVVGASTLPYLVAWRATPPGQVYVGTSEASDDDYPTYLTKMRAGARGEWTYRSPYAPGLESTLHVRPLYGLLGAISAAAGVPLWQGFHGGRLVLGVLCLIALHGLATAVTRSRGELRCAFLLAVVGSGIGGFLGREGARASWSYDLWVPELNAAYAVLTNVHFPAALALLALCFLAAGRALGEGLWRSAAAAGAALGLLAVIHTYDVLPLTAALFVFGAIAVATGRLGTRRLLATAIVLAGTALPFIAFQLISLGIDPSLAHMGRAQPVGSAEAVITGAGLLIPLALVGLFPILRRGPTAGLVAAWACLVPLLLALPLPFARRMVAGWHVPLGLLAGVGLWRLLAALSPGWRRTVGAALALALCGFTTVEVVCYQIARFSRPFPGVHVSLPDDLLDSYRWLDAHATAGDVVLAPYGPSNWLPVYTDLRPWFGHWAETPDARQRSIRAQRFFSPRATARQRLALLRDGDIAWLLSSRGGAFAPAAEVDPENLPGVTLAHRQGSVAILRVELE